jgi:crotonobetainyl-CoA:carnitine CoA-transferase CaiB-like acyl-CoA transferase
MSSDLGTTTKERRGLEGIRVVECGEGVSAAYAAKLLADLGADVVKVEPPGGDLTRRRGPFPGDEIDPEKSGLFVYLNTNKRGIVADLRSGEGSAVLDRLLAEADILFHNVPPSERAACGLAPADLAARNPALVVASVSPFGDSGPHATWKGYELTASNAGGWAFLSPGASPHPELPPLKPFGSQCDYTAGAYAAATAIAAYRHKRATGKGQTIEVSEQEAVAAMLEMNFMHWTYAGRETSRLGSRLLGPWFIADCADGKIFAVTAEEDQWQRLVELMGNPEWTKEEIFKDRLARGQNMDALKALMTDWLAEWKVADLYREAQGRRIPFAAVNRMEQIYANEHLRERKFFVSFEQPGVGKLTLPGAPSQYGKMHWSLRRPAPRLDEHREEVLRAASAARNTVPASPKAVRAAGGPLAGIRVLDFTQVWAGPFCTLNLAHLGAEVIRIETTARTPCITRMIPPFLDSQPGPGRAGYYNQYNQGKKSILLDLRKPEAVAVAFELATHCDVVTDNFAAGVIEKLGFGYEKLRAVKPDIIQISMSGYGQTGPFRRYLGYGPPASAAAGLFFATGYEGHGPAEIGVSYPDPNAGLLGAYAILAALLYRDLTGEGQYIDQSQLEAVLAHMAEGLLEWDMNRREPERRGNHDRWMAPHETYKAKGDDDKWVSIATGSEKDWRALCEVMGKPSLADDPRFATAAKRKENEAALDDTITAWTRERDRWEITEALQKAGVAAFLSMSNRDLGEDRHLDERGYLVRLEHPVVGRRIHAGIPWKMSGTPCEVRHAAPLAGADTDEVLRTLLGYSPERIAELRAAEVLK